MLARVVVWPAAWRCLAFCLMDNHVHLLIETPLAQPRRPGMQWLHGRFAQQFNAAPRAQRPRLRGPLRLGPDEERRAPLDGRSRTSRATPWPPACVRHRSTGRGAATAPSAGRAAVPVARPRAARSRTTTPWAASRRRRYLEAVDAHVAPDFQDRAAWRLLHAPGLRAAGRFARASLSGGIPYAWTYLGRRVRRTDRVGPGGACERAVLARGAHPRRAVPVPAAHRQRRLRRPALRRHDRLRPDRALDGVEHGHHGARDAGAVGVLAGLRVVLHRLERQGQRRRRDLDARRRPADLQEKLVVTPATGIPNGSTFHVVVAYSGTPQNFVDSDTSLEGFMRTSRAATRPWAPSR